MKKRISIFLVISMLASFFQCAVFAEGKFALSNLIIRQDSEKSTIYWVNDEEISELEIVDKNTGTVVDVSSASLEKGAINSVEAPLPQTTDELVEYQITCNNKSILLQSEQVINSNSTYGPLNSDGWSVGARTKLCAAEISEDSGSNALHITRYGNAMLWFSGTVADGYEAGKDYKLSFDYKGKNATSVSIRFGGVSKTIDLTDTSEWTTVSEVFTVRTVTSQLTVQVTGTDVDMSIDNVSAYLYENEVEDGENFIENGDFESTAVPVSLSEITAMGIDGGVEFSWQEADCNGYMVWIDGEYSAFLHKGTTSYNITGLEDDTLVTIEIAVKGKNGLLSDKIQASASSGILNMPVPEQSGYQPKYVIARNENGEFVVVWKNPDIAPSSAALYRLTENGEEYIEATYNLGANVVNAIKPGGKATDYYKLKLEFSDGTVMEYFVTIRNVGYWQIHCNWQESNEQNSWRRAYHLTDENPHNGKYAYHLFKLDDKKAHLLYTGDASAIQPGTYKVGFWYRGSDYTNISVSLGTEQIVACSPVYNKWNYAEAEFEVSTEAPQLKFMLNQRPDVYLDDVTLYKVENGMVTGENLLENGDFETVNSFGPVKSYTAQAKDGSVDISWELPGSSDCAGVNVYVNNQLKGSFFAGKNNVTIGGLINGRKNKVKLITINPSASPIGGVVEFEVIPEEAAYSVSEFVLKKNGVRVKGLSEGSFTVELSVKNNQLDTMDATLVTAVYVDGQMQPLLTDSKNVTQSEASGTAFSNSFTISQDMLDKELEVKCFVIDSINGKQALSGKVVFK